MSELTFFHWISRTSLIHKRNISINEAMRTEAICATRDLSVLSSLKFMWTILWILNCIWKATDKFCGGKDKSWSICKKILNWAFAKSLPNYCTGFYDLTFRGKSASQSISKYKFKIWQVIIIQNITFEMFKWKKIFRQMCISLGAGERRFHWVVS